LPFVEEGAVYQGVDFNVGFAAQPAICKTKIGLYTCPSDTDDMTRVDAGVEFARTSYGFSIGNWLGFDVPTATCGDGPFGINFRPKSANITDGLSHTIGAAEVKSFTACLLDGGNPPGPNAPVPSTPAEVVAYGGTFDPDWGHTQWVAGRTLQSGITTTFPPNTLVPYSNAGKTYDVDFTSSRFGVGNNPQTYRVVTARSYHPGGVNTMLLDGSVRFVSDSVSQKIWRAYGTRAGGEAVGDLE
jgi:prepilin-type processing-associated H-X9-DG protein